MNYLAAMSQNVEGIEVDFKESQKCYEMAINKGNFEAMNGYGDLIHKNYEIEIDSQEAIKCYNIIFNYNDARALYLYASTKRSKTFDQRRIIIIKRRKLFCF